MCKWIVRYQGSQKTGRKYSLRNFFSSIQNESSTFFTLRPEKQNRKSFSSQWKEKMAWNQRIMYLRIWDRIFLKTITIAEESCSHLSWMVWRKKYIKWATSILSSTPHSNKWRLKYRTCVCIYPIFRASKSNCRRRRRTIKERSISSILSCRISKRRRKMSRTELKMWLKTISMKENTVINYKSEMTMMRNYKTNIKCQRAFTR